MQMSTCSAPDTGTPLIVKSGLHKSCECHPGVLQQDTAACTGLLHLCLVSIIMNAAIAPGLAADMDSDYRAHAPLSFTHTAKAVHTYAQACSKIALKL